MGDWALYITGWVLVVANLFFFAWSMTLLPDPTAMVGFINLIVGGQLLYQVLTFEF